MINKKLIFIIIVAFTIFIVYYFYYINSPSINKEYFLNHQIEYWEFVNEFVKSGKWCIDIDGIVDNNANYLLKEESNVFLRDMCNQWVWSDKLEYLYRELHIAEVSTFQDSILLKIKTNKWNVSNLSIIYQTGKGKDLPNNMINIDEERSLLWE